MLGQEADLKLPTEFEGEGPNMHYDGALFNAFVDVYADKRICIPPGREETSDENTAFFKLCTYSNQGCHRPSRSKKIEQRAIPRTRTRTRLMIPSMSMLDISLPPPLLIEAAANRVMAMMKLVAERSSCT